MILNDSNSKPEARTYAKPRIVKKPEAPTQSDEIVKAIRDLLDSHAIGNPDDNIVRRVNNLIAQKEKSFLDRLRLVHQKILLRNELARLVKRIEDETGIGQNN